MQNPTSGLIFAVWKNREVFHKSDKLREGCVPYLDLFPVQASFHLIGLLHRVKGGEIE